MSISFRKIKTKWTSTETMRKQKVAVSCNKLSKAHAVVLLTLALFSVVYLISVNALATKGYEIKELERGITAQKKENERLQLQIIEKQSMSSLQKKIAELGFVSSDSVQYITPSAAVAAAKPTATAQ